MWPVLPRQLVGQVVRERLTHHVHPLPGLPGGTVGSHQARVLILSRVRWRLRVTALERGKAVVLPGPGIVLQGLEAEHRVPDGAEAAEQLTDTGELLDVHEDSQRNPAATRWISATASSPVAAASWRWSKNVM